MFNGYVVKNYEFIQLIGSGGMGEIWSARRTTLGDLVAIKILKAHKFEDLGKAFKNFEKEAQATSLISHPNVCKVYDFFEEDNNYFLVMEYLEGLDLSKALLMNKASADDTYKFALYVCRQVLRALNVAHNLKSPSVSKILHRDIKPANIFITIHNEVRLLDLGIAKIETDFDTTRSTEVGYSKNYSSPDLWEDGQYKGERYAENHDLYSLSVVFREICKGDIPDIASPNFKNVMERWCAENPEERIQTAGEILKDVENECERLGVNDFILRKVLRFERPGSQDTVSAPSGAQKDKRNSKIKKSFTSVGLLVTTFAVLLGGALWLTTKKSFSEGSEFGITFVDKNWFVKLGPLKDSRIDLSELKCKVREDFEDCTYREGAGDEPGAKHFRIQMDLKKNILTAYMGVYGQEEGRILTRKVRKDLKKYKYVFDSEINGYLAKGSLVTLSTIGPDFSSVTLDSSNLLELQQIPFKKIPASQAPKATKFSFVVPAEHIHKIELGLFDDLFEKIKHLATCRAWSEVQMNCTLASNSAQELFNEDDIKLHFSFEKGKTTFVQYSFRMDGVYTHMINTLSKSKDLIRGRQEKGSRFWFSKTESIELNRVTFNKMQAYTLTVRKMNPDKLAEAMETGYVHHF